MKNIKEIILTVAGVSSLLFLIILLLPWKLFNLGKVRMDQPNIVTVIGQAESQQKNQIATFTAGVNIVKANKDQAINEVNQKVNDLINSLKEFGISENDITTQTLSVYQQQDYQKSTTDKNLWSVTNSIEITLRNIDETSALTDLLNKSGANNVYGPNFRFEDTSVIQKSLFTKAIMDAKSKAEIMAKASGRRLGKILSVTEGNNGGVNPYYALRSDMGGMGGSAVEIGSATINQSVTVVFELK